MLSFVASAMISEVEDRFTDVLKLLSLSREWTNSLSLCNLVNCKIYLHAAGQAMDLE